MGELYNNPLNIEIINLTSSWSGQIGIYADGYNSISDRKAKINYNPQKDRYRMAQTFTTQSGDVTPITKEFRKTLIESTKNLSWQDARKQIKKRIKEVYPHKNITRVDFSKPFAHFDSKITGLRAPFRLFKGKGYLGKKNKNGKPAPLNNLCDVTKRFAPSSENNPDKYCKNVKKRMQEIHPDFTGILEEKHVPSMVLAFLKEENNEEYEKYYLTEEALAYDWKVAEHASQEDRPMSVTGKDFEIGYKLHLNPNIVRLELETLLDSDGGSFSGGSVPRGLYE